MSDGVKPATASKGSRELREARESDRSPFATSAKFVAPITPRPTSVLGQLEGVGPHLAEALRKHFRGDASGNRSAQDPVAL